MTKTPIYGLTGNMGCGKTTVARFFEEFSDVVVFDADKIAKEVLSDKRNSKSIIKALGPKVFSGGKIDLGKVAHLVFNDFEALERLEKFIHPRVWRAICQKAKKHKGISFFLVEAALIYEGGWDKFLEAVIVVTCEGAEQHRRLLDRGNLPAKEIAKRLARQLSNEEKVKRADFIVDNTCSPEETRRKVQDLYKRLKGGI